ncbi:hypothetical protein [Burkholderia sp. BCC1998]|uniref:hypothetical protein n=1 Tax=Burkholderia sp. BCC1998 TaxID=2817447 RepID=UPI002AB7C317|nr:hypothetical protein [Burkholderia sp. BCC1998]
MKAGARDRCADMPPGFCLKNIETKLLKKISAEHAGRHAAPCNRLRRRTQRPE